MRRFRPGCLVLALAAGLWGCASAPDRPHPVVLAIGSVTNQSRRPDATAEVLACLQEPLVAKGWYVVPPLVSTRFEDPARLGADAVLSVTIVQWNYGSGLASGQVSVQLRMELCLVATGEVLWRHDAVGGAVTGLLDPFGSAVTYSKGPGQRELGIAAAVLEDALADFPRGGLKGSGQ
jgi:hypothetical protein